MCGVPPLWEQQSSPAHLAGGCDRNPLARLHPSTYLGIQIHTVLRVRPCNQGVIRLMDKILHYLKDPKLWELWYIPYYGSCRILSISRNLLFCRVWGYSEPRHRLLRAQAPSVDLNPTGDPMPCKSSGSANDPGDPHSRTSLIYVEST